MQASERKESLWRQKDKGKVVLALDGAYMQVALVLRGPVGGIWGEHHGRSRRHVDIRTGC